jgi:hypothetical protein
LVSRLSERRAAAGRGHGLQGGRRTSARPGPGLDAIEFAQWMTPPVR